jgi:hypothetical protein
MSSVTQMSLVMSFLLIMLVSPFSYASDIDLPTNKKDSCNKIFSVVYDSFLFKSKKTIIKQAFSKVQFIKSSLPKNCVNQKLLLTKLLSVNPDFIMYSLEAGEGLTEFRTDNSKLVVKPNYFSVKLHFENLDDQDLRSSKKARTDSSKFGTPLYSSVFFEHSKTEHKAVVYLP